MWICLNDGFFSVVEDRDDHDYVWVRARNPRHLENLIPNIEVQLTPEADYCSRTRILKSELADVLTGKVLGINYPNFKNSVKEPQLKRLYSDFWLLGLHYQEAISAA